MEGMFWQWVGLRDMLAFKVFFFFLFRMKRVAFLSVKKSLFACSHFLVVVPLNV